MPGSPPRAPHLIPSGAHGVSRRGGDNYPTRLTTGSRTFLPARRRTARVGPDVGPTCSSSSSRASASSARAAELVVAAIRRARRAPAHTTAARRSRDRHGAREDAPSRWRHCKSLRAFRATVHKCLESPRPDRCGEARAVSGPRGDDGMVLFKALSELSFRAPARSSWALPTNNGDLLSKLRRAY